MSEPLERETGPGRIVLLLAALAAWGLYHAVGAFLFNRDVRRGLVVLACMAAFLGWWVLLLAHRKRKLRRRADANRLP